MENLAHLWSSLITRKVAFSLVIVIFTTVIKRLTLHAADIHLPEERTHRFVARKLVGYSVDFTMLLVIFVIWTQPIMTDISLEKFKESGITIASETIDIVRFPGTKPHQDTRNATH